MCKSTTGKRPAPPAEDRDSQRRRLTSPSDLLDLSSTPERPAKHAFNPSRPQQAINRLLVSPDHAGKSPSALAEAMNSSRATKFKPHPAIIARVYDFEFGRRGLSVMHFVRFDFAARRAWVLHVFAEEFFDHAKCRLLSCAREFIEELRSFCHWSAQDIATLTFWFDSVMEEYRSASEQDARLGSSTRSTITSKRSLQDPDLQSVLYIIQSERLDALGTAASALRRPPYNSARTSDPFRRSDTTRAKRKTLREVIDVLPRKGRQRVRMKNLSASGCASKSDDRPDCESLAAARIGRLVSAFRKARVSIPALLSTVSPDDAAKLFEEHDIVVGFSQVVKTLKLSLQEAVALWRNESESDSRPYKALDPRWLDILLHGYRYRLSVVKTATHGVTHAFTSPQEADSMPVSNHKSSSQYTTVFIRSIREGQVDGTYMMVTMDVALAWSELRFSPFGCVPKPRVNPQIETHLIHDLSWPDDSSVNARSTQEELPSLHFAPVSHIAQRIEDLATRYPGERIKILKGDVKWAFRNVPVAASLAAHFAGSCNADTAVVVLSLPFGWTGSSAHYGEFGGAISFMVSRESPNLMDPTDPDTDPFFSYVWVDDHLLVEIDDANRLMLAETALKLSMMATLGPYAINDKNILAVVYQTLRTGTRMEHGQEDRLDAHYKDHQGSRKNFRGFQRQIHSEKETREAPWVASPC
ncbi:hypothetical protein PPTG_17741 [Phytophthora nicotianae INRA-310]|uniref:Reverse transcriptase domain-containing protein n=1 Tax=Phytophthora nicotianae (strain INRA-310) TaxID=761204 RepID=W2PJJ5_PHYN3|nr:hypothetical protein PPTG_17741 [Phytophthora nicotianae INRA-310]ETN00771.1 hypothetical protein PPTG_17741 [Phytophthora nicotianae INRA-310]